MDLQELERWLAQARHTLTSAERDAQGGDFDWACFKAQQAGEYAIKGLLRGLGRPAYGHSIMRLLEELRAGHVDVPEELVEAAQELDIHYIPARYPDAYPEGSPFEFYNPRRAEEALRAARRILAWVREAV
ncbi:HEPN domain-containing protein [Meiothermus taiwanensis]|uniref:HEPN domain protein n=2 Tax=Meiothermus taiwanensis TaxID=172827 RepID=A0A399DVM4_9DEIN|nr:HEPN domain-containing protein [Meiothermus taiwanensis]AWR88016.1 hypothetical protein Mtai_v1c27920 [Meiothermus taiwanensis WR-220]KIQ53877.1 DNA-binding protein [Meiothermus taiwanensis]KZK15418.1 DNA-binding protein [Meiothermus taiwanensis]RIH76235.1 HEPN domain protein [Meiothermus taiwanensis]